jgi:hypothetical protein
LPRRYFQFALVVHAFFEFLNLAQKKELWPNSKEEVSMMPTQYIQHEIIITKSKRLPIDDGMKGNSEILPLPCNDSTTTNADRQHRRQIQNHPSRLHNKHPTHQSQLEIPRISSINELTENHYLPHSWVWACACHGGRVGGRIVGSIGLVVAVAVAVRKWRRDFGLDFRDF